MDASRTLVVVADDFGIGPETSRGILHLAGLGVVRATVLLVNSPHAAGAVSEWRRAGGSACVDLGWHPCLTLDRPLLSASRVPSLVGSDGVFHPLGRFLARLFAGRIVAAEVRAELLEQYRRFCDLVGRPPALVNGHHHVHILPVVRPALAEILQQQQPLPYVRRVRETWAMLRSAPHALAKRLFLGSFGRRSGALLSARGFPGNNSLVGLAGPEGLALADERASVRTLSLWLASAPGAVVELICHPGYSDETLDRCDRVSPLKAFVRTEQDARTRELRLLGGTSFGTLCRDAGLVPASPSGLGYVSAVRTPRAA